MTSAALLSGLTAPELLKRHRCNSPEITVTLDKLWARCGHGTTPNQDLPQNAEGPGGGWQVLAARVTPVWDALAGHPNGLLSPGMQCVVNPGGGPTPQPAPPGGCGVAVPQ
jgi:hypothetical protein